MRAIQIPEAGGPEPLRLVEIETPRPGPGQVLVQVRAAGVCYRDLLDRQGAYPMMRRPVVTGHEFAGVITAVGPDVTGLAVGDRVANVHRAPCGACPGCRRGAEMHCTGSPFMYGLTADGGYAEQVLAPVASLVPLPDGLPEEQACFLHCTAAVALRGLRDRGGLQAGETVLVTGASGGVGIHAVQLVKILGGRAIALTSSPRKAEALRQAGADEVHLGEVPRSLRGGVDLVLELTGAPHFNSALRALRLGGRLVLIGNLLGQRVEINPGYLIVNEMAVIGSAGASRRDLGEILALAASGRLRPVLDSRYPLEQAAAAQARLQARDVIGRIVLVP